MITLSVLSFNGAASDGSLSVAFDELGGTIGRADTNQMVLPDPERTISRVHAQVAYRNGSYVVVDRGSNPVSVNGRPLGHGKEAPITAGDQVQIGGYLMEVRAAAAAQSSAADPFADLLGSPAGRAGQPAPDFDPLAGLGLAPPVAPPSPRSPPAWPAATGGATPFDAGMPASTPAAAAGGIPDDWDPFAPPPPARLPDGLGIGGRPSGNLGLDAGAAAPAPLIPDLDAGSGSASLDSLFGLKAAPLGDDPFAGSMLQAPMAQPNMAASVDPLASLSMAPQASAATRQDNLSDLNRPFIPPAQSTPPAPIASPPAAPQGAVLSWDAGDAGTEGHTVIRPKSAAAAAGAVTPRPAPALPVDPFADMVAAPVQPAAPTPPPSAQPPAASRPAAPLPSPISPAGPAAAAGSPPTAAAEVQALLDAFRDGLGTPTVTLPALTPELMRLLGQLLHESTRGTVELLVARAALKREVRAEATMIMAKENNPLKFSPSVEAALGHLLAPPTRGFMPAGPAMRDAYVDLRAHQFGMVAGMRAALEGVLERFDPARLEGRLTQLSALQSILPGARKARLWETFTELYGQIRSDAADDFHTVFGKAFLKAYEEHIDQLQRSDP